jgi:hypothetical protein
MLFVVPPSGGDSACDVLSSQPILRPKPGLQANPGKSIYCTVNRALTDRVAGAGLSAAEAPGFRAIAQWHSI